MRGDIVPYEGKIYICEKCFMLLADKNSCYVCYIKQYLEERINGHQQKQKEK